MHDIPWPPQGEEEMSPPGLARRLTAMRRRSQHTTFRSGFVAGVEVLAENILPGSPRREHAYRGPLPPELAQWLRDTVARVRAE